MRKIRIENLKELVHVVIALKQDNKFLIGKKLYDAWESEVTACKELEMSFATQYGEVSIETVVKFEHYCKAFYTLESITVNGNLIYGYSKYVDNHKKQIAIDVE